MRHIKRFVCLGSTSFARSIQALYGIFLLSWRLQWPPLFPTTFDKCIIVKDLLLRFLERNQRDCYISKTGTADHWCPFRRPFYSNLMPYYGAFFLLRSVLLPLLTLPSGFFYFLNLLPTSATELHCTPFCLSRNRQSIVVSFVFLTFQDLNRFSVLLVARILAYAAIDDALGVD